MPPGTYLFLLLQVFCLLETQSKRIFLFNLRRFSGFAGAKISHHVAHHAVQVYQLIDSGYIAAAACCKDHGERHQRCQEKDR